MYLEKLRLDGRIAVVTGGGQAIGLACVEALAEAGAKVVIADYNDKAAESGVGMGAAWASGAERPSASGAGALVSAPIVKKRVSLGGA